MRNEVKDALNWFQCLLNDMKLSPLSDIYSKGKEMLEILRKEIEKGEPQMTTIFDSRVYQRRNHTPWTRIALTPFMKEMAMHIEYDDTQKTYWDQIVELKCVYRPDVASRFWWEIEWTGEDGQRYRVSGQTLDLCLWRAAETELMTHAKIERQKTDSP